MRANRKYKELVKKGIMTQDEFNTKMHELLPTEEEPEEEAASDAENAESNDKYNILHIYCLRLERINHEH